MTNNNRQGSIGPVLIAVGSAAVLILFLLGWYPQNWFNGLFSGSNKLALIGSFGDFKPNTTIDDAARTIVADLVSAQSNSKTENVKWGGCFRNPAGGDDFYDIVSNISVSPDDGCTIGGSITHKSNINLPNGINFLRPASGKFTSVVFNVNGTTNSDKDTILEITNGAENRFIIITPSGFITYGLSEFVDTNSAPDSTSSPRATPRAQPATVIDRGVVVKPSAPINLSVSSGNGSVIVFWNPPVFNGNAPITQYRIYRSFVSNGARFIAGTNLPNSTTFTETGLVNGATYYYRVTAFNFLFESQESNEVAITPNGSSAVAPSPSPSPSSSSNDNEPSAPRSLEADAISSSKIKLTWDEPRNDGGSRITEYRLYRSTRSNGTFSKIADIDEDDSSYTNTGLKEDTTYYYKIRAVNREGEGDYSNQDSARTDSSNNNSSNNDNDEVPSAPRNFSADGGQNKISLSWSEPDDGGSRITEYYVYRSSTNSGSSSIIATIDDSVEEYTDTNLSNNKTYYYYVAAVNAVGRGPLSARASATTDQAQSGTPSSQCPNGQIGTPPNCVTPNNTPTTYAPATPSGLNIDHTGNTVYLSWHASSAATSYKIRRGTSPNSPSTTFEPGNTAITFTDSNLSYNTSYYYSVAAVNSAGASAYTTEVWTTTGTNPNQSTSSTSGATSQQGATSSPQACGSLMPPRQLNASNGTRSIVLNWQAPSCDGGSSIQKYYIRRSVGGGDMTFFEPINGNTYTFTDTWELASGTTYDYWVSAYNGSNQSDLSNKASVRRN